ncbi:BRO family protein, partial [Bacillus sp. CLL-7-23]
MNQIQTFKNEIFEVAAKVVNDQILFDVERVAKSLGIVDIKNGIKYVRWNRVNSYLPKVSPQVAKGDFIPEPLVYKLAFKAKNEVAEQFQDWLAIEVIPTIRKTGQYGGPRIL